MTGWVYFMLASDWLAGCTCGVRRLLIGRMFQQRHLTLAPLVVLQSKLLCSQPPPAPERLDQRSGNSGGTQKLALF